MLKKGKEKYLEKFKNLYFHKTGKVLSEDETLHEFENLILLVEAIYKPIQKSNEL